MCIRAHMHILTQAQLEHVVLAHFTVCVSLGCVCQQGLDCSYARQGCFGKKSDAMFRGEQDYLLFLFAFQRKRVSMFRGVQDYYKYT